MAEKNGKAPQMEEEQDLSEILRVRREKDVYKRQSLDGTTGNIYGEALPTVPASTEGGYFGRIMELSDKYRQMEVRTNADTPRDAKQAVAFGAQGIGLCLSLIPI